MRHLFLALLTIALLSPAFVSARTWHVPSEAPTIQAGIDFASAGDTVLVACGTYYEYDIVMKSGVCLRSETGEPECVTVNAESAGRGFICEDLDSSTSIVALTVTDGIPPSGPFPNSCGGGLWCDVSSLTLSGCVFRDNTSPLSGGGMFCHQSNVSLINCDFIENNAYCGGGLYIYRDASSELIGCRFMTNASVYEGAGVYCRFRSSPTLMNCEFLGNVAIGEVGYGGGGLLCWGECSPVLSECSFVDNQATEGSGGGIHFRDCGQIPSICSCVFARNVAIDGGGLCAIQTSVVMDNCTFSENEGGSGGGMHLRCHGHPYSHYSHINNTIVAFSLGGGSIACVTGCQRTSLTCCDLYGNVGGDWIGCIGNQNGVNGNISEDPLFCDPENGDLTISDISPCAPGQQPDCGLIGALGVGCGPTATVPTTWGLVKSIFQLRGGR